jgi:hypothetical protein
MSFYPWFAALVCCQLGTGGGAWSAEPLPVFDFTREVEAREWGEAHDVSVLRPTGEGLEVAVSGDDPYFSGPARDYPDDVPLWLLLRLRSDQAGSGEVFYFRDHPEPGKSVRFSVPGGRWTEARVALPSLGPAHRLRIDPPGGGGVVVLSGIRFEERVSYPEPEWPAWTPAGSAPERVVSSGDLEVFTGPETPFGVDLRVRGERFASAHPRPRIAYLGGNDVRWIDLAAAVTRETPGEDSLRLTAKARDPDGCEWTCVHFFRRGPAPGVVEVETSVACSADRTVLYVPMHAFLAGEGSFGRSKGQGLLAGLEYLDDEPSSSEADIVGPESDRRVPASHKVTFPLMAVQAGGRYLGLVWDRPQDFAPLFDSPDRTFGSGGHLLGVIYPGCDGTDREEGRLFPYFGRVLKAGRPLVSRAWIIGGAGDSVVPAVRHYVGLRGLPDQPGTGLDLAGYVALASQGWLDSKCREGDLYRHAVWPGFGPQPAADAAVFQVWLAAHSAGAAGAAALRAAAADALTAVPPRERYHSGIGHVRTPVAALLTGAVDEAVEAAREIARGQLGRFEPDGSLRYRPGGRGPDYGKTHFAPDANGMTAQAVATVLEAAAFCGDRGLVEAGLAKLRAMEKFRNSVPRGAQTWEVPLHTPDILASAHLVRAFTLGYQLTGDRNLLDQAVHWAWTGVPFVYLVNPTGQPVGPYSTIAVLGATSWEAPVWFGRPVQWCGMVYADALYRLAPHDASGPWADLADGITAAALQHIWRADDPERVGLLPDFFELREQARAGPAINPATVGIGAVRLFGGGPLYGFEAFRESGLFVHVPGEIVAGSESAGSARFTVRGWPDQPYPVLVTGVTGQPVVNVDGEAAPAEVDRGPGRLLLTVEGEVRVEIRVTR